MVHIREDADGDASGQRSRCWRVSGLDLEWITDGGLDALTARMAGVNLNSGGTGSAGPAATAAPADRAGGRVWAEVCGRQRLRGSSGRGPRGPDHVAAVWWQRRWGSGCRRRGDAVLLPGEPTPMARAYSGPAAKKILEARGA
jgi:hypothetical protein